MRKWIDDERCHKIPWENPTTLKPYGMDPSWILKQNLPQMPETLRLDLRVSPGGSLGIDKSSKYYLNLITIVTYIYTHMCICIYIHICIYMYTYMLFCLYMHNLNDDVKRTCSILSIDLLFIDDVCMCVYIYNTLYAGSL